MRQGQRRLVDLPAFAAGNLQDEDFMRVVVRTEPPGIAGSDVDIGVHGMVEIFLNSRGQCAERRPRAVERRQRNGGAGLIFGANAIEIRYAGENVIARADISGERLARKEPAILGQLDRGISETSR